MKKNKEKRLFLLNACGKSGFCVETTIFRWKMVRINFVDFKLLNGTIRTSIRQSGIEISTINYLVVSSLCFSTKKWHLLPKF